MHRYTVWFRRALWLGIIADWLLGIPTIFAPRIVLGLLGLRPTGDPVWTAFAALLVVLLSLFYIPGASKPHRYRLNAWFAVLARPPGVLFFLVFLPGAYPLFGLLDLVLFLIQFPLLLKALREEPAEEDAWHEPAASQIRLEDRGTVVWFKRAVWLGILADWVLGIPTIFAPEWVLGLLGLRPTGDPVWTSFAAMILILLSIFYIPGANRPFRYRSNALLAVWARPPGVIFFWLLWPGKYFLFGLMDLALFLIQFVLLVKVMQLMPDPGPETDEDVREYQGSSYREVREAAFAGPYGEPLPYHLGLRPGTFLQFLNDSSRNMHDRRDIRPYYDKLIHSNGVTFSGRWMIDRPSPYTGYFAEGSEGLLVARASVAGLLIRRGHKRSFGIAGKVFPTLDPDERVWVGNFVTVSHLSGSRAKNIIDIEVSNAPTVGPSLAANLINRVIFRLMDSRPGYRQLFPISTLGVPPGAPVVTPDLLRLVVAGGTPRVDADDFRDELRLESYPDGKLVYEIQVKNFDEDSWTRLGVLELTDYAISEGGDKRLHFWIPRDVPTAPKPPGLSSGAPR